MHLQAGPAETTNYMILGFTLIFGVLFIYLSSFKLRSRNLHRDLELLTTPGKKLKKVAAKKRKTAR